MRNRSALGLLLMVGWAGAIVLRGSFVPVASAGETLLGGALLTASVRARPARTPAEAAALGGLDMHFPSQLDTFHFFNIEPIDTNLRLRWFDANGGVPVLEQNVLVPARDLIVFPLPAQLGPGFNGSLLASSDQAVVRGVVNRLLDGTADSRFAAIPTSDLPLTVSNIGHPVFGNTGFLIQNAAAQNLTVRTFISDLTGAQPATFKSSTLGEGEIVIVKPNQVPGASGLRPERAHWSRSPFGPRAATWTPVPNRGTGDTGDWIASGGFQDGRSAVCAPVPGGGSDAVASVVDWWVLNVGAGLEEVITRIWNDSGQLEGQQTDSTPAGGMSMVSTAFLTDGPGMLCSETTSGNATLLAVTHFGSAPGNRSRVDPASGGWRAIGTDDAITKLGYAFGAPSTKNSKVAVVLHNVGDKKAKVKVVAYRAGSINRRGKKLFSRTVRIDPNATATVPYVKRARGDDLYAEIRVRGKGQVLAWLQRTFDIDVDYYPAAKVK